MRTATMICGLLALAACTGERPVPATPAADTVVVPPPTDSARRRDSAAHRGDSVMARDTASGI